MTFHPDSGYEINKLKLSSRRASCRAAAERTGLCRSLLLVLMEMALLVLLSASAPAGAVAVRLFRRRVPFRAPQCLHNAFKQTHCSSLTEQYRIGPIVSKLRFIFHTKLMTKDRDPDGQLVQQSRA